MKRTVLLLLVTLAVIVGGCNNGSDSSWSPPSKTLAGYWEAVVPDGDFDGNVDETPTYYIFLDIVSHERGTVSGYYFQQVGTKTSRAALTGYTNGDEFYLSTGLDGEVLEFSGSLTSHTDALNKDHFVADWKSSTGHSGTIIFTSVDSNTNIDALNLEGQTHSAVPSELAALKKDGGTGQLLVFVHGLMSHATVWDKIVDRLKAEGYFKKYEIWRLDYDTRQPFEEIGLEFYDLMKEKGLLNRNPIIVAHSMGGLVSREFVTLAGGCEELITLGTPHVGTPEGAGGIFTGPGTVEMLPCSLNLLALYEKESKLMYVGNIHVTPFDSYAVVSGKITGSWKWITVRKCLSHCPPFGPCCADIKVYTFVFDRDYNPLLKAGWVYIKTAGFGEDNDGAVPTASANFCAGPRDKFPCEICPHIRDKHFTNYDHFMLTDPDVAPDVYAFIVRHL